MAFVPITSNDQDGYSSGTSNTDVFVQQGVMLSGEFIALTLWSTSHDVIVQGAVVSAGSGINLGPSASSVGNCTLSVAEGGLVAGGTAAQLLGSGNHVTNNGDIMGQVQGLTLYGNGGASTVENFGLISARGDAVFMGGFGFTQAITLKNTGEIAGGVNAYLGGDGTDTIVNRGVMDGNIVLGSGNDVYSGGLGALDGAVSGGGGNDRIICGADDNFMNGNWGSDTLTGGAGEDQFYFNSALGASNVDTIRDFRAADDTILLENAVFTQITGTGTLSSAQFAANTDGFATQADDRIIYETDTGRLIYDSNGSAAGGATVFAVLSGAPAINAADFSVF